MIYFIQTGESGPIKIGKSKDPVKRMKDLQGSAPHCLHLIAVANEMKYPEKDLHARFAELRLSGEWFRPEQALLNFIADLRLEDMKAGILVKGDKVYCRLCGLKFLPNDPSVEIKHRKMHLEIRRGKLPRLVRDILESCSWMLLCQAPDRLFRKYDVENLKLAVAFSLWESARVKNIPETAFEAFMLDHLQLIEASLDGSDEDKLRASDKVGRRWSLYKEKNSPLLDRKRGHL